MLALWLRDSRLQWRLCAGVFRAAAKKDCHSEARARRKRGNQKSSVLTAHREAVQTRMTAEQELSVEKNLPGLMCRRGIRREPRPRDNGFPE
jgi:hypothetical protein